MPYPYISGSGSKVFKGITLLVGILFSPGFFSLILNIIAGYTITYRWFFKVEDQVKIGNGIGEVTGIRLLVIYLRSLKNEEIIIAIAHLFLTLLLSSKFLFIIKKLVY